MKISISLGFGEGESLSVDCRVIEMQVQTMNLVWMREVDAKWMYEMGKRISEERAGYKKA